MCEGKEEYRHFYLEDTSLITGSAIVYSLGLHGVLHLYSHIIFCFTPMYCIFRLPVKTLTLKDIRYSKEASLFLSKNSVKGGNPIISSYPPFT